MLCLQKNENESVSMRKNKKNERKCLFVLIYKKRRRRERKNVYICRKLDGSGNIFDILAQS